MVSVDVNTLGKCEHCGKVFTLRDMPADAMNAAWKCSGCKKDLGPASLGMKEKDAGSNEWEKALWIGPGGKWVSQEPKMSFKIGNFDVYPTPLPMW